MPTTTTVSHPTFTILLFTQLVRRLRITNARYDLIAYQCRRAQRPTYHAKRRANWVGLHIDTSKARAAWPDDHVHVSVSAASTQVSERAAGSPTSVATETATEAVDKSYWSPEEDACLLPSNLFVARKQPWTCLSPLGLELRSIDDVKMCGLPFQQVPVPGAPRWRPKPLPEADTLTCKPLSPGAARTYVWQSVIARHSVGYAGLGTCHLKRKLREVGVDGSAVFRTRRRR